jgi:hypothetical protein
MDGIWPIHIWFPLRQFTPPTLLVPTYSIFLFVLYALSRAIKIQTITMYV